MRRVLDRFYSANEGLAGAFIVLICLTVLIQVAFNIVDKLTVTAGFGAVGLVIPSYAEFTGYFLAAATFFALAGTLKGGAHIRVNLFLQRAPTWLRAKLELWCCLLGIAMAGYFTYWTANLVYESWTFGDLSPGIVPVPIWIPQLSMALGLICLLISFVDSLIGLWSGGDPYGQ